VTLNAKISALEPHAQEQERSHQGSGRPRFGLVTQHQPPQQMGGYYVSDDQRQRIQPVTTNTDEVEQPSPDQDGGGRPVFVVRIEVPGHRVGRLCWRGSPTRPNETTDGWTNTPGVTQRLSG